jgi:hypothetical protein
MNTKKLYYYRLYFTGVVTIVIWSLLVWTHYHGGVQSHHLLHREELPSISNWWSGLLIPFLSWILLYRIQKRVLVAQFEKSLLVKLYGNIMRAFIFSLCYGILISILFTYHVASIPGYMILGILLIAFFYPVYRSECILGFVLGMSVTFGAFIPIMVACIFSLIGLLIYRFIRPVLLKIIPVNDKQ